MKENTSIPSVWVEMGHYALAWGSTSLFGMEAWLVEQWRRGRLNGLRGKGSQDTHGNHNDRERRSVLRVTPIALFIAFF